MVLVNGAEGIGTGYSTFIPAYNPKDIINNLRNIINGKGQNDLVPWYNGFTGQIKKSLFQSFFMHKNSRNYDG